MWLSELPTDLKSEIEGRRGSVFFGSADDSVVRMAQENYCKVTH